MDIITALWIFAAVCFLLPIISGLWKCYGPGRKVKILLKDDETGRITRTGIGHSYGSAVVDLCYKLYSSAPTSKISSIQDRIDSMNKVISEYKGRMNKQELKNCEEYRDRLKKYIQTLQERVAAEEKEKQREKEERHRKAEAERKRKEAEKKQEQLEKEKTMSEKKRYIAAQRRLMTDSLRYDVMNRDGFRCVLCGASPKTNPNIILHVDHIIPLARGDRGRFSVSFCILKVGGWRLAVSDVKY